jgi:hypothetical protein
MDRLLANPTLTFLARLRGNNGNIGVTHGLEGQYRRNISRSDVVILHPRLWHWELQVHVDQGGM